MMLCYIILSYIIIYDIILYSYASRGPRPTSAAAAPRRRCRRRCGRGRPIPAYTLYII